MDTRGKVLVAMSGGVDSSVAACLLQEQGYDVVGVFMRLGAETVGQEMPAGPTLGGTLPGEGNNGPDAGATDLGMHKRDVGKAGGRGDNGETGVKESAADASATTIPLGLRKDQAAESRHRGCCSADDATDARVVAGRLGIPFYALNFQKDFSRLIDYFADEYAAARTPNPCVMCNQWLKFGRLLEYADVVEADWIATGHYARIDHSGDRPRLLRGRDDAKDQSYVLFGMGSAVLRRTLLPLGGMTKAEVRDHARRFGLALHDKPESQDICFVPDRDYARVVRARRPDAFRPGRIRHVDGRDLGEHDGLANFTIGQRRGVNVAVGTPVYVTELDAATDTVVVGPRECLLSDAAEASEVNWQIDPPIVPIKTTVKIRYNHSGAAGVAHPLPGDRVRVEFDEPQTAVTPGQAIVMYEGDQVLGGGWIDG